MGNAANKAGILTGQLDSYCLPCERRVPSAPAALDAHAAGAEHAARVEHDVFPFENIRKVPIGYYCQVCNEVMKTKAEAKTHFKSSTHSTAKEYKEVEAVRNFVKRTDDGIVAFDLVKIDDKAWNGIIGEVCILCQEIINLRNMKPHFESIDHFINVIKNPVLHNAFNLFRSISNDAYKAPPSLQCLICNTLVPHETGLEAHFLQAFHELMFRAASDHRIYRRQLPVFDINASVDTVDYLYYARQSGHFVCLLCHWVVLEHETKSHVLDVHHTTMVELLRKWMEKKKKSMYVVVPASEVDVAQALEKLQIEDSLTTDDGKEEAKEDGKGRQKKASKDDVDPLQSEAMQYLSNYFGLRWKNGCPYCGCCRTKVKGPTENLKGHIASYKHRKVFFKTYKVSEERADKVRMFDWNVQSKRLYQTVKSLIVVRNITCITNLSYNVMIKEANGYRCYLCKMVVKPHEHHHSEMHQRILNNCLVVTSFDKEFIREVCDQLYHCGHCNKIYKSWGQLIDHLMTRFHRKNRTLGLRIRNEYAQNMDIFDDF